MVSRKKYTEGNRTTPKMVCRVCLKDHPIRFCRKFLKENYQERMRIVSFYKYCAGCLSHDHTWRTCRSTGKCKRCGDMHHTLLHKPSSRPRTSRQNGNKNVKHLRKGPGASNRKTERGPSSSQLPEEGPSSSNVQESERPSTCRALVPAGSRNIALTPRKKSKGRSGSSSVSIPLYQITEMIILKPTALIKIVANERYILERAVIDPSAEFSITSDEVVKRLNARTVKVGKTERCLITIRGNFGMSTTVETYAQVRRDYCVITPTKSLDDSIVDDFLGLQLADPQFNVSYKAHLSDVYPRIIKNGIAGGTFGKPLAQFSIFGYIISGSFAK
ncbi:uncharacterized protein LOC135948867 [Calliphora vicina]|uniref:uncharacterized protein LOC135948867 n=1 Tax=Calliphora vicina TaxID=7373 RepID=UPI00325A5BE2